MQIAQGIYRITNGFVNYYLIREPGGELHLIDAGLPGNIRGLERFCKRYQLNLAQLKNIWITHADGDHYGGVSGLLTRYPGVKVWAHPVEAQAMRIGGSSRALTPHGFEKVFYNLAGRLMPSRPIRVDEELQDGMVLPVLEGLQVIHTPGHTPGHISFYLPGLKILFSGDSITTNRSGLVPSFGGNTWEPEEARRSYLLQADLRPDIIAGGHCFVSGNAFEKMKIL